MHPFLSQKKSLFDGHIDRLAKELSGLRTGRASPALVEQVKVSAYDSMMELNALASITVQDARTLLIQPWDKGLAQAIEKAIRESGLGLNPSADGGAIRITLPQMTEENRKELVKTMKEKVEEAKVGLRRSREEVRASVIAMEKEKQMSEDEKFKLLDELDKLVKDVAQKMDEIAGKKEAEIMTV